MIVYLYICIYITLILLLLDLSSLYRWITYEHLYITVGTGDQINNNRGITSKFTSDIIYSTCNLTFEFSVRYKKNCKLKVAEGKIRVDVYAKPTNSFSYTSPNTCYPKNNICNIPKGIALRLRRICDDDEHLINVLLNIRTTL